MLNFCQLRLFGLLLLFILVPAVELALLIKLSGHIGPPATVGLIVVTGVVGAYLARRQGLSVLRQMQAETAAGRLPAGSIVDGVIILLAGALLITPGILTDAFGFLCLIPVTRRLIRAYLWRRVQRAVQDGRIQVYMHLDPQGRGPLRPPPPPSHDDDVRDVL